jgi:hypothetical protein
VTVDGASGYPLLSNGEPDYLGLGSERNGGGTGRNTARFLDGLSSVKERPSSERDGGPNKSPRNVVTFEPSSSGQSSATGSRSRTPAALDKPLFAPAAGAAGAVNRPAISVNHIDPSGLAISRTERAMSLGGDDGPELSNINAAISVASGGAISARGNGHPINMSTGHGELIHGGQPSARKVVSPTP